MLQLKRAVPVAWPCRSPVAWSYRSPGTSLRRSPRAATRRRIIKSLQQKAMSIRVGEGHTNTEPGSNSCSALALMRFVLLFKDTFLWSRLALMYMSCYCMDSPAAACCAAILCFPFICTAFRYVYVWLHPFSFLSPVLCCNLLVFPICLFVVFE